jgi:hypothetical protein
MRRLAATSVRPEEPRTADDEVAFRGMKLHVDGAVRVRAYGPGTGFGAVGRT